MRVVILAGGMGTRLAEETEVRPKPMVEIGDMPILWHIMKHFGHYGHNEFFVALGYRGEVIKRFFMDFFTLQGNFTIDIQQREVVRHAFEHEDWKVHLVDTGLHSMTGGRVKRLQPQLENEPFLLTYGDGVSDVNLDNLLNFHRSHGKLCTITAVRPPSRFGGLIFDGPLVAEFSEKPQAGEGWINGGFMVMEPAVFEYFSGDGCVMEKEVLEVLAKEGKLAAYQHEGFWQCMDTIRDKRLLESLWQGGNAAWKVWNE